MAGDEFEILFFFRKNFDQGLGRGESIRRVRLGELIALEEEC
jgi:hypothetical protein